MDRWLAMVGAFQLRRNAMLVVDLGTAVTADLVDENGLHLGGYICPGLSLLRKSVTYSYAAHTLFDGGGAFLVRRSRAWAHYR